MNKQIIEDTIETLKLPIDQNVGLYQDEETPCCVGARLAGYFGLRHFYDGLDAFAKELGGNRAHIMIMLREVGASQYPLSSSKWPTLPHIVWQNLLEIEVLPDLRKADLRNITLDRADLSGADLEGANLNDNDLIGINLMGANLRYATLRGTILEEANLQNADLEGADLRGANLCETNLKGANLEGADLEGADLRWTDLSGIILEGVIK